MERERRRFIFPADNTRTLNFHYIQLENHTRHCASLFQGYVHGICSNRCKHYREAFGDLTKVNALMGKSSLDGVSKFQPTAFNSNMIAFKYKCGTKGGKVVSSQDEQKKQTLPLGSQALEPRMAPHLSGVLRRAGQRTKGASSLQCSFFLSKNSEGTFDS